jgi:hypothetical protein
MICGPSQLEYLHHLLDGSTLELLVNGVQVGSPFCPEVQLRFWAGVDSSLQGLVWICLEDIFYLSGPSDNTRLEDMDAVVILCESQLLGIEAFDICNSRASVATKRRLRHVAKCIADMDIEQRRPQVTGQRG